MLSTVTDMVHRGSALPLFAALIHMGLRERNEAIDALEEMNDPKIAAGLHAISYVHVFDELQTDPRFQKLLAREKNMSIVQ